MSNEYTDSGMEYESGLVGPSGMSFTLMPVTGVHTKQDVQAAKNELRRDRDVVGIIEVRWQPNPSNTVFDVPKIEARIAELREAKRESLDLELPEHDLMSHWKEPLLSKEEHKEYEYSNKWERLSPEDYEDEEKERQEEIEELGEAIKELKEEISVVEQEQLDRQEMLAVLEKELAELEAKNP